MLQLAAPLALAELGWMAMGVVDTIMAGRLGRGGDRRGQARQHAVLSHRDLRHGHAAGHGHAGGAGVRRRRTRAIAGAR